ncbi:MAG TPA: response regulator, partial [Anaerolineales bacterium]|nr:response regulator [Anaerolineales bacterium]
MSAKILIVDDEPSARLTLENLLFAEGYTLQFAKNGTEGLAQAHAWHPDVILSDVMMPDMDGFELCRRVRADEQLAQVPFILITALNDRHAKINGLQAGADDFLSKPIDTIELRARLRTL